MPEEYRRPATGLLALEVPRVAADAALLGPAWPLLRRCPKGDGHPVLVLPGFTASDVSTRLLRRFLSGLGYHVHPWLLGRNLGPSPSLVDGLRRRFAELSERHGRPVSLVGWSLGGIFAREIARAAPEQVRLVVTMGSPFRLRYPGSTNAGTLFAAARERRGGFSDPRAAEEERGAMPVPATSIYTRTDGVVPWRSCLEIPSPTSESIEVVGSHSGLGFNPAVLWVVADRLAQPQGNWRPFRPTGPARVLFPRRRPA